MVGSEDVRVLYEDRVMGPATALRVFMAESSGSHKPSLKLGRRGEHCIHRSPKHNTDISDSPHKNAFIICLKGGIFKKIQEF